MIIYRRQEIQAYPKAAKPQPRQFVATWLCPPSFCQYDRAKFIVTEIPPPTQNRMNHQLDVSDLKPKLVLACAYSIRHVVAERAVFGFMLFHSIPFMLKSTEE